VCYFSTTYSKPEDYLTSEQLSALYHEFINEFPIVSIEDSHDQDDWAGWSAFTASTDVQVRSKGDVIWDYS
jgi:enolase